LKKERRERRRNGKESEKIKGERKREEEIDREMGVLSHEIFERRVAVGTVLSYLI
jgi:hypothetical protein